MTRVECERKIAEYMSAIRRTYLEYNPNADHLSMFLTKSTNGNDEGDWDCWFMNANNTYWDDDKDYPLEFTIHKDIKDEKYWACVTEEEDREMMQDRAYDDMLLSDASIFCPGRIA